MNQNSQQVTHKTKSLQYTSGKINKVCSIYDHSNNECQLYCQTSVTDILHKFSFLLNDITLAMPIRTLRSGILLLWSPSCKEMAFAFFSNWEDTHSLATSIIKNTLKIYKFFTKIRNMKLIIFTAIEWAVHYSILFLLVRVLLIIPSNKKNRCKVKILLAPV